MPPTERGRNGAERVGPNLRWMLYPTTEGIVGPPIPTVTEVVPVAEVASLYAEIVRLEAEAALVETLVIERDEAFDEIDRLEARHAQGCEHVERFRQIASNLKRLSDELVTLYGPIEGLTR